MKIELAPLKVAEGERVKLSDRPTQAAPLYSSKRDYEETLQAHAQELQRLHERLFAHGRHALLVILQGMDTAGKDGAIRHALSGVNPQGCRVASFKTPSAVELRHDFLWRGQAELPEHGAIAIFNRSYYEAVLIERVHPKLLQGEGFDPPANLDRFFDRRLRAIRDFERLLDESQTKVVKIFLHISKDEQKRRLIARLEDPEKNWKASMADVEERRFWDDYARAYEAMLPATSVAAAPWFVVPADDKKNARLTVSQIMIEALGSLPNSAPKPNAERREELKRIEAALRQ